jgi:ubiquinone/menaquinone biosynthesis C-methylase UbiE
MIKRTVAFIIFSFLLALFNSSIAQDQTHDDSESHQHQHQEKAANLEKDKDRWMWQLPEQVLDSIGVDSGMVVADVGAGNGYFTIRLAQRVGGEGVVYANEIEELFLKVIQDRCQSEGFDNVKTVLGHPDDPNLPDTAMDIVLLVNVIHLVENKILFMQNMGRCIKPGGILAIVQWDAAKLAAEAPRGGPPPKLDEYDRDALIELINESGYTIKSTFTFLPLQNIYICQPL